MYIKGKTNIFADNLLRLPVVAGEIKQENNKSTDNNVQDALETLAESLLYYPADAPMFPLGIENIRLQQQQDPVILAL